MNLFKVMLFGALSVFLAACQPQIYITSETTITERPSRSQERYPRGQEVFACTTVAAVYEYLENGGVSAGCGRMYMTTPRYRPDFYTYEGDRFRIIEFQVGWYTYYTYEERGRRSRYWQY